MKLDAAALTFIAEDLGKRTPPPLRYLSALSRHADPVVREGVVYGAAAAMDRSEDARALLRRMADSDPNGIVRGCAAEALDIGLSGEAEAIERERAIVDKGAVLP